MFSLFSKFEKVVKTVRAYSYKRGGKRVKVATHQRSVTRKKNTAQPTTTNRKKMSLPPLELFSELSPARQQKVRANHARLQKDIQKRDAAEKRQRYESIRPKPSQSQQKRWVRRGDTIEVWTGFSWHLTIVEDVWPDRARCVDYYADENGWGMYIWNDPQSVHLWRYST